ncbi:DUF3862 domain-containing protein [Xylocopilactobacillus apicola]|uniref:Lipoprotein n=1 Tax=Xylocopilactobacillus apicola TaxID=2932184 RepID=A0AAU9DYC7_9LACO|nr:DUF3862 domain-containing protein [Xylocopilactobacillus apicola]BDR59178.1 hypothetical protein XA3_16190 [Xylocopilactobacillus apicola]
MKKTTIIVSVLILSLMTGCTKKVEDHPKSHSVSSKSQSSKKKSSAPKVQKEISLADYQALKLDHPTKKSTVISKWGQPAENYKEKGSLRESAIWQGESGSHVIIIFDQKEEIISKFLTNTKTKRTNTITLADFQKIKKGQTPEQVKAILGEPDGYLDLGPVDEEKGMNSYNYMYNLAKSDPEKEANISIDFVDDQVYLLNQKNLK